MHRPTAVLVGLCAHGLAIARALHRHGIRVIALETNAELPGVLTRCADVRFVRDINGLGLIESLVHLREEISGNVHPVLFLTNDRMVETVGRHIQMLDGLYRLSWASSADRLLPLLRKDEIEQVCVRTGLAYPKSCVVHHVDEEQALSLPLRYPVIAKPVKPISEFKTLVFDSAASLQAEKARIKRCLPVIFQEFIPGTDECIRFGAMYLKDGQVLARFEGRKIRSRPMGHTTIAVSEPSDHVHELAKRFFDDLRLSGPVSLELKFDPSGDAWVIEPTVGRTDFWVGLCIENGVNLPLLEFTSEIGESTVVPIQNEEAVWINGDRDPAGFFWFLIHAPELLIGRKVFGVFLSSRDLKPSWASLKGLVAASGAAISRRLARLFGMGRSGAHAS